MGVLARRELFKRHFEFVAVRPIRLTSKETIPAGTVLDKTKFKLFHLRSLWNRRRIGQADSPWANAMLKSVDNAHARPEAQLVKPQVEISEPIESRPIEFMESGVIEGDPHPVGGVDDALVHDTMGASVEIVETDKGWRAIYVNGALVTRVRGQEAVDAWMEENGYGAAS